MIRLLPLFLITPVALLAGSILDHTSSPDEVTDWAPILSQAMIKAGKGGQLHFPGPRTYRMASPVELPHDFTLRFDSAATLEAQKTLFVIRRSGRYLLEGIGEQASLHATEKESALIDLRELPAGEEVHLTVRRLTFQGTNGIHGISESRYIPEKGTLRELLIEECRFKTSYTAISYHQGNVGSLRVNNSEFVDSYRGIFVSCPISEGAYIRGNRFLNIGARAIGLGGGKAHMIDDGALDHINAVTVHDNQILGGGHGATDQTAYIAGILVYGTNVSIQGNIVRDFNRGEPVPGERVGHHFPMPDGSYHRTPWLPVPGKKPRRLAGAAIYAKARSGLIANNICTNSGWRAAIEVKTGGRQPYFLVTNNVIDGRSLAIEESFGVEPNVAKALWTNNVFYNMPNTAFKVSNRMQSVYTNNVIYDSKIGFTISGAPHDYPELIAHNHFSGVETPVKASQGAEIHATVIPFPVSAPGLPSAPLSAPSPPANSASSSPSAPAASRP